MGFDQNGNIENAAAAAAATSKNGKEGRAGLFFFATLYTFFFVGALFGWGPMQRVRVLMDG